jgi:hypothetical protein
VGKWAQYSKRGSAPLFGNVAAPALADFTVGVPTATTIPLTRVAAIPAGSTSMLWRAINNATGVLTAPFNPSPLTGLTTATQYRVQAAWFNGSQQVSDPSPTVLVTTA